MSETPNIFSFDGDRSGKLSEERLQAYLEGKLTPEQQHEVELWLSEEGLEGDAAEGLQKLSAEEAKSSTHRLNRQLQKQLGERRRKRKNFYSEGNGLIVVIFLVLLLCVIAYVVIRFAVR